MRVHFVMRCGHVQEWPPGGALGVGSFFCALEGVVSERVGPSCRENRKRRRLRKLDSRVADFLSCIAGSRVE